MRKGAVKSPTVCTVSGACARQDRPGRGLQRQLSATHADAQRRVVVSAMTIWICASQRARRRRMRAMICSPE